MSGPTHSEWRLVTTSPGGSSWETPCDSDADAREYAALQVADGFTVTIQRRWVGAWEDVK